VTHGLRGKRRETNEATDRQQWHARHDWNTCSATSTLPNGALTCTPCTISLTFVNISARDRHAFGEHRLLAALLRLPHAL